MVCVPTERASEANEISPELSAKLSPKTPSILDIQRTMSSSGGISASLAVPVKRISSPFPTPSPSSGDSKEHVGASLGGPTSISCDNVVVLLALSFTLS